MTANTDALRIRREPPPFRHMSVRRTQRPTPRMVRVTFAGDDLAGLAVEEPAASVRLLLPSEGSDELILPAWSGNEFLLPGGERPVIRTFTPPLLDATSTELDLWIVIHEGGAASAWAEAAASGDVAAVSGPGRGYTIDDDAPGFVVAGDETALPAIAQLLDHIPATAEVEVHAEITHAGAELPLPDHPQATVTWHELPQGAPPGTTLVAAVERADLHPTWQVWAAGEAAGMQRLRKLLARRDFPRRRSTVRGYWKRRS